MVNWAFVYLGYVLILSIIVGLGFALHKSFKRGAKLVVFLYTFALIWLSRFGVNLFRMGADISVFEKVLDSFVHALQTFSMDEDYSTFIIVGKGLFHSIGEVNLAEIYGLIVSTLNVAAPIIGGALFLEIITGFFPSFKLWLNQKRRKFVFSELNEEAILLAEDLYFGDQYQNIIATEYLNDEGTEEVSDKRGFFEQLLGFKKPLLVFANVTAVGENEQKSDLIDRAKALNAILLSADLPFISLSRSKSVYYFFVSTKTGENVLSLEALLQRQGEKPKVYPGGAERDDIRTRIYVFCKREVDVRLVHTISKEVEEREALIIRTISDYTKAAIDLMYEVPLFIPLLNRRRGSGRDDMEEGKLSELGAFIVERDEEGRLGGVVPTRELHVTVIGDFLLAEEVVKAAYWCGQIAGVQLFIHILTDNSAHFKARLESSAPELLESCKAKSPMLKCYPKSTSPLYNPPYAIVDGLDGDVEVENYLNYQDILALTDYVVIALENEDKNVELALKLRLELYRRGLSQDLSSHPVIAPAVFSKGLAQTIKVEEPGLYEPYLMPFALGHERFSCKSVFMSDITVDAWEMGSTYSKKKHQKQKDDEYSFWANINRAIHAPYKLFAFGWIEDVDFGRVGAGKYRGRGSDVDLRDTVFSWMEHRRWNAYLRSTGFSGPKEEDYEAYYKLKGSHKDLGLKYHNCLVESSLRGNALPEGGDYDPSFLDALDLISMKAYSLDCERKAVEEDAKERQDSEYKRWDSFENDMAAQSLRDKLLQNNGES